MTPQPPSQVPPPGGPGVASFFDRIRSYGAVRPDEGRWFAGVAAGLARRWGVDPLLVRGGFVILTLFGGIGLFLYGLGWLFLPHPDGRIHAQEVLRGVVTPGFVGGLLFVLLDLGSSGWSHDGWFGPHPFGGGLLLVALVALAVWWFAGGRHRRWPGGPGGPGGPRGWGGPGGPSWGGPGSGRPGPGWGRPGWGRPGWGGPGWEGPQGAPPSAPGSPGDQEGPRTDAGGEASHHYGERDAAGATDGAGDRAGEETVGGTGGGTGDRAGDVPGAGGVPPYGTPPATPPNAYWAGGHPSAGYSASGYSTSYLTSPVAGSPSPGAEPSWPASGSGARTGVLAPPPPAWTPRPDVQRPSHAWTNGVLGAALLAAAVVVIWNLLWSVPGSVGFVAAGVALGIVALGIIAAGVWGRRAGGLAPIGILLALVTLAGGSAAGRVTWAGERLWTPGAVQGATSYSLGVGNGRLDLRQVSAPSASSASPAEINVRVGIGNLTVVVPSGVAVRILGTSGAGNIDNAAGLSPSPGGPPLQTPGTRRGPSVDLDLQTAPNPVIVVRADVGVGNLTIDRASS